MTASSKENNKPLANLNDKLLKLLNERCLIASYLLSPLFKVTNPEHTSQFKLVKAPRSNRVNDFDQLNNTSYPI